MNTYLLCQNEFSENSETDFCFPCLLKILRKLHLALKNSDDIEIVPETKPLIFKITSNLSDDVSANTAYLEELSRAFSDLLKKPCVCIDAR